MTDDRSPVPYVVRPTDTLEDAMAVIEANRHRSVIVVNDDRIVVGTLADGDVRKAILDRRLLSTPVADVMNTNFIAVAPADAERAAEIFEREHVFLVPVVDENGRLVDLRTAYD
jgi:CBS domain-containing protein